jgi:hypothetical protein
VRAASPLAALAALVLAACSGGDGGDGRLSREEYVRRADAICLEYDGRLAALGDAGSIGEVAELADEALPIAREGVAELRALRPPAELEREVSRWLDRNEESVANIEALAEAARSGDVTRVQVAARTAARNEREADALAKRLGLRDCARAD